MLAPRCGWATLALATLAAVSHLAAPVHSAAPSPASPRPSFEDPRSLWRLPDAGEHVRCRDAMLEFFNALENGTDWARQMVDASGRRGAGAAWGNHMWLGSQTQCAQLTGRGRFHVATVRLGSPPPPERTKPPPPNADGPPPPTNVSAPKQWPLLLGLCAPAACDAPALRSAFVLPPQAQLLLLRPAPHPTFSVTALPAFYGLLVAVGVAALLALSGTALDAGLRRRARLRAHRYAVCCATPAPGSVTTLVAPALAPALAPTLGPASAKSLVAECSAAAPIPFVDPSPAPSSAGSDAGTDPPPHDSDLGLPARALLCFSVRINLAKICDTRTQESLSCLHGLRVFSLVWVIAGHTCMFAFPFSDNKRFRQLVEKDFLFQSIGNGAFSVDTFFFISGLLVCYIFLKVSSKEEENKGKSKIKGGLADSAIQFVGVFTYRFLRLTPPYLLVMLMSYLTSQWFTHNSIFPNPVADEVNCPKYWWRNLLFINTLFPVDRMCMIWSWYLANDTQFYTLAVILLLLSIRFPKTAIASLVILVVCSLITTMVIVINMDHTPRVEEPLGLFDALYDKPWMRLGPYAVGMAAGLLLFRTGLKIHLHKAVVVTGWAAAMLLSFSLVHGLYGALGPVASAAYVSLSHTAWSLSVAWLTIACCSGYGGPVNKLLSHPVFYPLSRITYCAYLTHPLVILGVLMFMDAPIHMSRGTMSVAIFGFIVASYLLSLVVSLLFEAPAIALINLLHPIRRKSRLGDPPLHSTEGITSAKEKKVLLRRNP